MKKDISTTKKLIIAIILSSLILSSIIPIVQASSLKFVEGFDNGPAFTNVVPMKKVTFVRFDNKTYNDDYAYLASIPTAVFRNQDENGKDLLFSHPLLYYQDKLKNDDIDYKILDTYPGIEFFMEDFMSYSDGKLDELTLINLGREELNNSWKANNYNTINGTNPYQLANEIALHDWSYSNDAIVAVIEEDYQKPMIKYEGSVSGNLPVGYNIDEINFQMEKPAIGVGGNYEDFEIIPPYKYVIANMFWDNVGIDLDLQLYDNQLGMADADSKWNVFYGAGETASSYVYNYGRWEVGVTYMPTQSLSTEEGKMRSMYQNVPEDNSLLSKLGLGKKDTQDVEILLYPGTELEIDDSTPYGCRNVEFTLKWDNPNIALGFIILDPSGAETASAPSNDEIVEGVEKGLMERTINLERLGESSEDEKYKICVFTLDDIKKPLDFTIEYSWDQNFSRIEGDCLASATEGAVLGSMLNAPLLYASRDKITQNTKDVLYKLGVENIHLINLGNHISKNVRNDLKEIAVVKEYVDYRELYDDIKDLTGSQDVIFSTIDPWTYYYTEDQVPVGDEPGALFIGPAAYIAAFHGSPVLLVDNHPKLSQAVVWHTNFWQTTANLSYRPDLPSVACMVLTGRSVVDFLESYGFVLPKEKENLATMITVADHFDIGVTWDRTFTGRLIPGRFCGTPVDTAYWIARSSFYPSLIFENPALQGLVSLENGSKSVSKPYIGKLLPPLGTDLHIIRPSQMEDYNYPILHTYNIFLYNFNRDAKDHWGGVYTTANGIIPYETPSPYSIDVGTTDKVGAFYPDIHETEVTPLYAQRAGYSNCFSSNFEICCENLNRGVIMWMESCHGGNGNFGALGFWDYDSKYVDELNPWRPYERPALAFRNWDEFTFYSDHVFEKLNLPKFTLLMKLARLITIPIEILTVDRGSTEDPDQAVMNPDIKPYFFNDGFSTDLQIKETKGLSLIPIIGRLFRTHHDGVVIDPSLMGDNVLSKKNGLDFEEHLGNLHSMGLNAVSCLVSHTYFHTVMIRHGTPYQIMDPWSTSWYSGIWLHSIPRQLALGYTMGEAYEMGMEEVGIQYLIDQWWWDLNENVLFYGDPDIRVWTPKTEWDPEHKNHWEQDEIQPIKYDEYLNIEGHTPYGATNYPYQREPDTFSQIWLFFIIAIIIILIIVLAVIGRKKKK